MIALLNRNIKLFFRDKSTVFFSLLGVLIVFGLYILFLGDVMLQNLPNVPGASFLMSSWVMAGILSVTAITTTLGAFGIMVEDKNKGVRKDFWVSPLSRRALTGGYIASTFVIGLLFSLIALLIAEIYIFATGGTLLSFAALLQVLGCILLSVFASSAMMLFIVTLFQSQNAFAAASTVVGTLIGFLTGIYIPIGSLPTAVQFVIKIFPISHAASLFRQIMLETPAAETFHGAPPEVLRTFQRDFGVMFQFGETTVSALTSILILVATGIVFYCLSLLRLSKKITQ